jgi:hypothetical protein
MAIGLSRRGRWSKPNRGPDRHRRQTALEEEALRPKMAGLRPPTSALRCPVRKVQRRFGAWCPKPGQEPEESFELLGSRRSFVVPSWLVAALHRS